MAVSSFIQVLSLKCDVETVVKMPCHLVWYCNGSGLGWGKEEFSIALMKLCLCANRSCSVALTSFSALPSGTSHLFAGRLCTVLICFNASLLSDLIAIFFLPCLFPLPFWTLQRNPWYFLTGTIRQCAPASELRE